MEFWDWAAILKISSVHLICLPGAGIWSEERRRANCSSWGYLPTYLLFGGGLRCFGSWVLRLDWTALDFITLPCFGLERRMGWSSTDRIGREQKWCWVSDFNTRGIQSTVWFLDIFCLDVLVNINLLSDMKWENINLTCFQTLICRSVDWNVGCVIAPQRQEQRSAFIYHDPSVDENPGGLRCLMSDLGRNRDREAPPSFRPHCNSDRRFLQALPHLWGESN